MEGGNFIASLRRSGSAWRSSSTRDVFSRSSREQDDEEALKWAALEKLPTYDRIRKGILTASTGDRMEVEVENLDFQDRKKILDRLVRVADEDNEKFLNGHEMNEFVPQRTSAYISQHDPPFAMNSRDVDRAIEKREGSKH